MAKSIYDNPPLLENSSSLDELLQGIGECRLVFLGEASHGTHEYYTWRAKISQRLIREKGFSFLAVEGDWPDCYRINRFIKNYPDSEKDTDQVLREFQRWPTWMWANWEIAAFIHWLRQWNERQEIERKTGFYGLDVYSLWESLEEIFKYLQKKHPEALPIAREAMKCFEPYWKEEKLYAQTVSLVPESCQNEVVDLLAELRRHVPKYNGDSEESLNAEQNALITVNAEEYYRIMMKPGPVSWNLRDHHMMATLERLLNFHGNNAKGIVWAHNTHIGDARATDMREEGAINIGQLARERYGEKDTFLVGFGSYRGTVIAGRTWGAEMQILPLPPAKSGSLEAYFHNSSLKKNLLLSKHLESDENLFYPLPHRAVGVVYNPEYERFGNYVPSLLPERYDAFLYLDETSALHPLHIIPDRHQVPETFPWGI